MGCGSSSAADPREAGNEFDEAGVAATK